MVGCPTAFAASIAKKAIKSIEVGFIVRLIYKAASAWFSWLVHDSGQREFAISNDTSCVEVFCLFQSGFCCGQAVILPVAVSGESLLDRQQEKLNWFHWIVF